MPRLAMKYRYVISILGLAACLLLLSLIVSCDRNASPQDPVEDETAMADKPGGPAGDPVEKAGPDPVAGPASSTSARPNGKVEPPAPGPASGLTPMTATADQMEAVFREGSKYPHLLKLKHSGPEILFVANQLLALPETEAAHSRLADWMDDRDWIRIERITSSALLLEWQGHDAEQFVTVRDQLLKAFPEDMIIEPNGIMSAFASVTDPFYAEQFHHQQMNSEAGWNIRTSAKGVLIAVLDSGMDVDHEDLRDSVFRNSVEIPANGIDDDQNGFIDDHSGWDFVEDDAVPNDDDGHGTHMSGLIGAAANNGKGGAGVAWEADLLPVRFLDGEGNGAVVDLLDALDYILIMEADVINASFGRYSYSKVEEQAFRKVTEAGIVVVCAAGNNGLSVDETPTYPLCYDIPGIIGVGAMSRDGAKTGFSNYGKSAVDVFAPGSLLYSTFKDNGYRYGSGTSQAAALVTGAVGLLKSLDGSLGGEDIRQHLILNSVYEPKLEAYSEHSVVLDLGLLLGLQAEQPPLITLQPGPKSLKAGEDLVLEVEFESRSLYTVTWHNLDGPLSGGTGKRYVVERAMPEHSSTYWVVIENRYGSVKSEEIEVEITAEPPRIVNYTPSASLLIGMPLQLRVEADGSSPLSYQWYKDGSSIAGANGDSYTVHRTKGSDVGIYTVEVSNPWGSVFSGNMRVTGETGSSLNWMNLNHAFEPTGVKQGGGALFYYSGSHSDYVTSQDYLGWDRMNIDPEEVVEFGPWLINGHYYYLNQASGLKESSDLESWEDLVHIPVSSNEVSSIVVFPNGLLVASGMFHFIALPSGEVHAYAPPDSGSPPTAFDDGADLRTSSGKTLHSTDGLNWEMVGSDLPRRLARDPRSSMTVGISGDDFPMTFVVSSNGTDWVEVSEATYPQDTYAGGYIFDGSQRYDLSTGEWMNTSYGLVEAFDDFVVLQDFRNQIYTQDLPDGPVLHFDRFSFGRYTGQFRAFQGEMYSFTSYGLFRWEVDGPPVEIFNGTERLSSWGILGTVGDSLVLKKGDRYLRMDSESSFTELEMPDFIRNRGYIRQNGSVFYTNFGTGEVWTSMDMENWTHEPGFPGLEVARFGNHLVGMAESESRDSILVYRKNFAEWKWEQVHEFPPADHPGYSLLGGPNGFVVLYERSVYTSTNGIDWLLSFDGADSIDLVNGNLYLRADSFFHGSTNGGQTWASVPQIPESEERSEFFAARGNRIARLDGNPIHQPPVLRHDGFGYNVRAPAVRDIQISLNDRSKLARIEAYVDGRLQERLDPWTRTFALEVEEPGVKKVRVEAVYLDGWTAVSKEISVVTAIPMIPVASGWIGGTHSRSLGVTAHAGDNAFYAVERQFGNIYRTEDGESWDMIIENFSGPHHQFFEPRDGFLVVSLGLPTSEVLGIVKGSGPDEWINIANPKHEVFTTFAIFEWLEGLYALFADGDLYEIFPDGSITFVRRLDIPDRVYEELNPLNLRMSATSSGSTVRITLGSADETFLTDDLTTLRPFNLPEGWRFTRGLRLVNSDFSAYRIIQNASGNLSPIRYFAVSGFESLDEPFKGWFVGQRDGFTWVGNEHGQFFPLAGDEVPGDFVWRKGSRLMFVGYRGNFQTVVAYEFEARGLEIADSAGGSSATGELQIANYGIVAPLTDEQVNCEVFLHSASPDGPSWDLGLIPVDLSRNIPARVTAFDFEAVLPAGLLFGEYYLELHLDADDRYVEWDETNNRVTSNVFVYDPQVTLFASARGEGEVGSNQYASSMDPGTLVQLTAQPEEGYAFVQWSGSVEARSSMIQVAMDASKLVEAHFVPEWLLETREDLGWTGIPGWYKTRTGSAIFPVSSAAAYMEDFGWMFGNSLSPAAFWNPELGWLMRLPDMEAYFVFSSPGWLIYENGEYVYLPLPQ